MLKGYKYLDDRRFAAAYVSTHRKTSGKGPDVLFRELKLKGIDDELIHEALSSFSFSDQVEAAVKHAEKVLKKEKAVLQRDEAGHRTAPCQKGFLLRCHFGRASGNRLRKRRWR